MVTEKRLSSLPDVGSLKRLAQSLAVLDAIMSPERESRYYAFDPRWAEGEMTASMRDGSGDEYFILFNPHGAIIKGFAHESPMSPYATESGKPWPGVLDEVPGEFRQFLSEPAFAIEDTTFCVWRRHDDPVWQVGNINYPEGRDPDGSEDLLAILDGEPSAYKEFAEKYYEREVDLSAVEHVYRHKPLTNKVVTALNAGSSLERLKSDIEEIGYRGDAA